MPSRTTARRVALPRRPTPGRRCAAPGSARCRHRRARRGVASRATAAAAGTAADGVTVVLAHGWTLTHESWLPVVELLRARFGVRVVAFDQPGHGRSTPESRTPTVHELGEVLHRVLTALAPTGPLVLAGHSMGGMTIMAWAADHADELAARVRGVVFVATSAKVGRGPAAAAPRAGAHAGLGPRSTGGARPADVDPGRRPGCSTVAARRARRSCPGSRSSGTPRCRRWGATSWPCSSTTRPRPCSTSVRCPPGCWSAPPTGSPR